jgi:hypothetical protein
MAGMDGRQKPPRRIEISLTQLIAGSAAAACGAWLASKIGVAGTVIGAAIVSAFVTVLSAIYAHGARRARERLLVHREVLRLRPRLPASYAEGAAPAPEDRVDEEDELSATRTMLLPAIELEDARGYRWGRIALAALAVFVVAMLVITAIELISGRSFACSAAGLNCDTGTTVPGISQPRSTPTKSTSRPTPSASVTPTPSTSFSVSTTPSQTTTPSSTDTGTVSPSPTDTTTTSPTSTTG